MRDTKNLHDFAAIATAYQQKVMKITEDNIRFALEYAQALGGARSPAELMEINQTFTARRLELFRQHTAEISALSPFQLPTANAEDMRTPTT